MKLEEWIKTCKPTKIVGNPDREICGLEIDSRQVKAGYAFVAMRGTQVDGHTFIGKAQDQGASVIVCEKLPETPDDGVTYLLYPHTTDVVGKLATVFWGEPSRKMKLVGVTGTNGKTTIATLLYRIFRRMGYKTGLCSTVCNYIDDRAVPTECTTPDAITLNKLLAQMAEAGCEYVFMEVSSHSIAQKRIGGLHFCGGIFTNLTRDHLDYHKTFENYRDAKKAFFDSLPAKAFAITNADDKNGLIMVQNTKATVKTYSQRQYADFMGEILEESFEGMSLEVNKKEVSTQFVGHFNVSNLLAVFGTLVMMGISEEEALIQMSAMKPVNGRFETISSGIGVTAIVDYAHTPDALENVLETIREVLKERGKCWTVCGCGGNRDKGKRPQMAAIAAEMSDQVILTSDNPRDEDPEEIIRDMEAGVKHFKNRVRSIVDRREAILYACLHAQKGDVILVAGKGHEDYQIVKGVKHHFDDHEEVRKAFARRNETDRKNGI